MQEQDHPADDRAVLIVARRRTRWECTSAPRVGPRGLVDRAGTVVGLELLELMGPADGSRVLTVLETVAQSTLSEVLHARVLGTDGHPRWCEIQAHGLGSASDEVVLLLRETPDREAPPVAVVTAALSDPLTGAATRPVLVDHAGQALRRLSREHLSVALLFLDLDGLKRVNDTLGHRAGDEVLRELCRRVSALLRPADTFARMGGDEFAVLVGDLHDPADAELLARRIVAVAREPLEVEGVMVDCSASVGLTVTSDARQAVEVLLHRADIAMYQAKRAGGGRWRTWGLEDEDRFLARARIEGLLGQALRTRQIVLDYQPVVELTSFAFVGAEARLRVPGPGDELLSPSTFLDVATSRRLIRGLDLEVLRQAMADRKAGWPTVPLVLNLSAHDLEDDLWGKQALGELVLHQASASDLRVEVREDVLRSLTPPALERLQRLRHDGMHVGLDGFGSSLTALSSLWTYPLDYLTLDRSLTRQLADAPRARALARTVCDLAHSLDLLVVASGIETVEQLGQARESGCDHGQGALWPSWSLTAGPASTRAAGSPEPA